MAKGTPKFEVATLAELPAAAKYEHGVIVATDQGNTWYYSDGTSWTTIGGGSGAVTLTTIAASGTARDLAFPSTGGVAYDVTLNDNCTFTISGGAASQLLTITLILRQDATAGRIATLPAGIKWPGGVAPLLNTAAGRIDVLYISTPDAGTTLIGRY